MLTLYTRVCRWYIDILHACTWWRYENEIEYVNMYMFLRSRKLNFQMELMLMICGECENKNTCRLHCTPRSGAVYAFSVLTPQCLKWTILLTCKHSIGAECRNKKTNEFRKIIYMQLSKLRNLWVISVVCHFCMCMLVGPILTYLSPLHLFYRRILSSHASEH